MRHSISALAVPALSLAWLIVAMLIFFAISHYDFVQIYFLPLVFPWSELFARVVPGEFVLGLLQALAGVMVFSTACVSLGLAIMGRHEKSEASAVALGTTAFLVGEIIFSLIFLSAIVLYKLTPVMVAIALALGLAAGVQRLIAFLGAQPRLQLAAGLERPQQLVLGLVIASMALAVLYTSAILNYDSVVEYFSHAKIMAVTQTAVYTNPTDPFFVSSLHPGILYTALIEIFGDQSARMLSWMNGLAILLLGVAIGEQTELGSQARLGFLAAMLTSTAFVDLLGDGKIELLSTAPLLAAIYWMLRSLKRPARSTFAWIGFLLGFSIIARPYNLFLAPVFAVAFYGFQLWSRRRIGDFDLGGFASAALWMLPPLLAMGVFHLLQNWLWLGSPLAPLASGRTVSAGAWQWQFDPRLLNVYRLFYPFVVSFSNSPQSLGNISPFFVGFLPFLLIKRVREGLREKPALLGLAMAAVVTIVLWLVFFFTVVEIRYVLFLWVVLFVALGCVMDRAARQLNSPVRRLIVPMVGLLLVYMGARTLIVALETYAPVDRNGQAHCAGLVFCTFLEPLNQSAAPGERVFVANAYRYYLRPDLFACSSRAQEVATLADLARKNSPDFWGALYRGGFRYVTYEDNYSNFHSFFAPLPSPQLAPAWLHVTQLFATPDGLERIYELEASAAPIQPGSYCERDSAGIWQVRSGAPAN